MQDLLNRKENNTMFESFSDLALCTLAVALLLVALLAVNITQRINIDLKKNRFSTAPEVSTLYLACSTPDFSRTASDAFRIERVLHGADPNVFVHLVDEGWSRTPTEEADRKKLSEGLSLPLARFLMLAPGIEPAVDRGSATPFFQSASFLGGREMVFEEDGETTCSSPVMAGLPEQLLTALWARADEMNTVAEGRDAAIYVETLVIPAASGEEHRIVIGHCSYRLPDALEDGSLAWLQEFMHGSVEIVYLGKAWIDPLNQTSKRIAFMESAGFTNCAYAYRDFVFSQAVTPGEQKLMAALEDLGVGKGEARERVLRSRLQKSASRALMNGTLSERLPGTVPPLIQYETAWQAYVAHCKEEEEDPPKWFYTEFLRPLGFELMKVSPETQHTDHPIVMNGEEQAAD